jgi:hypothetical protein
MVWTIRCFVVGIMVARQEMGLHVAEDDDLDLLRRGFPDMTDQITWAASATGTSSVARLMDMLHYYRWGAELFVMDLCLAKPVYAWLRQRQLSIRWLQQVASDFEQRSLQLRMSLGVMPCIETVLQSLVDTPPAAAAAVVKIKPMPEDRAASAEVRGASAASAAAGAAPGAVKGEVVKTEVKTEVEAASERAEAAWKRVDSLAKEMAQAMLHAAESSRLAAAASAASITARVTRSAKAAACPRSAAGEVIEVED